MNGSFFGLSIGASSLLTHQSALEVTGHNLANVNNEDFSRQRLEILPNLPIASPIGVKGSGIVQDSINRLHESFIERQISQATSQNSYDKTMLEGLFTIQTILDEPSDHAIGGALREFWNSWEALSLRPTDTGLRAQVIEEAKQLVRTFNNKIEAYLQEERYLDDRVEGKVGELNANLAKLAELNQQISQSELAGAQANDLRDQRDAVIKDISSVVPVDVVGDDNFLNVRLAGEGVWLVHRDQAFDVRVRAGDGTQPTTLVVEDAPITVTSGEMGAMLNLRNEVVPQLRNDLWTMMSTVVDRVNDLHASGYDAEGNRGLNLFNIEGEADRVTVVPSTQLRDVDLGAAIETGTHHLQVTSVDAQLKANQRTTLTDGTISLTQIGNYTGDAEINRDYHVRVISANSTAGSIGGAQVQLYLGDKPVGETYTLGGGGNSAVVQWDNVDGATMSIQASITLGSSGFLTPNERSDGLSTTGTVSLDGGPSVAVDLVSSNNITFVVGQGYGYASGGSATVNFDGGPFGGGSFTVWASDATLTVNWEIARSVNRVVAAAPPSDPNDPVALGDGEMARLIADLANVAIFEQESETANSFLGRIVQGVGEKALESKVFEEASSSVLLQLDAQRQSVSGVNLDEEMIRLLQFQRGFEAAARYVTTVDEMLARLINNVGLVGR